MIKIVFTGPESTGKTVLAERLAQQLRLPWVPEFARYYVAHLNRPYQRADLIAIGRGQWAWEQWFARQAPTVLLCDTDWTVLHVWEHYRFGTPAVGQWCWQQGYPKTEPAHYYFLCAPDFPWQPDPLREHPNEREALFRWYEQLLQEYRASYEVLCGPLERRTKAALRRIQALCRSQLV